MDGANVLIDRVVAFKHMEWWAGLRFAQFTSNATLVVWVSNQSIAGWLLMSLILNDRESKMPPPYGVALFGPLFFVDPFVTLGLIPFVAVLVFYE